MTSVPQHSPAAPDPNRLDPDLATRIIACGLFLALHEQLRADGPPPDFAQQLEVRRRRAHANLDASLDELARQVALGEYGPPVRPLRALPGGRG